MLGFKGTDAERIWQHSQLKWKDLKYLRRKRVGQEESERPEESKTRPSIPDTSIGFAILLSLTGIAQIYDSWIGHALIAIPGLMLIISALITGAMLRKDKEKANKSVRSS